MSMFEGMNDTIQVKRVTKPAIYRNVRYDGLKYTAASKKEDKSISAYVELFFTVFEETVQGTTKTVTERMLSKFVFCPPVQEDEVKYFNKKYDKKGIEIGTNNAEEQILEQWNETARLLIQLGQALGSDFDSLKTMFAKWVPEPKPGVFETMVKGFDAAFPASKFEKKRIDVKVIWKNSDKQKTSFLEIPRATAKNFVFAPHIPGHESMLELTAYEQKNCLKPKFTGTGNAPKSEDEIVEGRNYSGDDFSNGVNDAFSPGKAIEDIGKDVATDLF
jgi:hypothetical protein